MADDLDSTRERRGWSAYSVACLQVFPFSAVDDLWTFADESREPLGDAGQVRLCSSILDTLWHRAEISINQVHKICTCATSKISNYRQSWRATKEISVI